LNLEGLRIEGLESETVAAKFDLTLVAAELDHGLAGTFVYSADLFDASTVAGMAESLQQLLHDAVCSDEVGNHHVESCKFCKSKVSFTGFHDYQD